MSRWVGLGSMEPLPTFPGGKTADMEAGVGSRNRAARERECPAAACFLSGAGSKVIW